MNVKKRLFGVATVVALAAAGRPDLLCSSVAHRWFYLLL